ncbi:DUF3592 domain-containing protein [Ruminococcus sp. Marseille-P6503]|uniref:DUF3592 domain-containing protein n=1 Tax=Ruminococcus sp. Marseille-P6503 TaxID=2364796 RepID=UPI000F531D82|nr:DUF3592 domain-containing protein [Ruminococcus sp. Marseille-P6503]
MNDVISRTVCLASEGDDGTWVGKAGFFIDYMNVVAIVLIAVGIAIIYFGVKLLKGYTFHPDETVVVEKDKHFELINADIAERRVTEIPNYSASAKGGGNDVFKELRITYTVDGEEYSEWISDFGGYGNTVPVRYNPDDPKDFYVYEGDDAPESLPDESGSLAGNEDNDSDDSPSKGLGLVVLIVGGLISVLGVGFLIDFLTR